MPSATKPANINLKTVGNSQAKKNNIVTTGLRNAKTAKLP
jgi:hypothetical protein